MTATKLTPEDLIPQLREMDREQSIEVLSHYTKSELVKLAQVAEISANKAGNKDSIIGQISNHFGFRHLNTKMAQRPPMQR